MFESLTSFFETTIPLLKIEIWNNTLSDYLTSLVILVIGIILLLIASSFTYRYIKQRNLEADRSTEHFFIQLIKRYVFPLLYFGVFYLATRNLTLNEFLSNFFDITGVFLLSLVAIRFISKAIKHWFTNYLISKETDEKRILTIQKLLPVVNFAIWLIGLIFLLDNIGFNLTAVITGLGIGGVAVALASQSFLKDLFSYFTILFDHPFVEGDFIIVEDFLGTVEKIGIQSTRVRSLSGEQIIIPNTQLTDARIKNYKEMYERRVEFDIGVVYETPLEKLQKIPVIIKTIIGNTASTRFDRAHFYKYGDYHLNFVVVYYVLSSDYNLYMDIQQNINLQIFEEFKKSEIAFAYPTQLVHVNQLPLEKS